MSDAYWRYSDSRQMPSSAMSSIAGKRSRSDYDVSAVHDLATYFPRDDDRGGLRVIRDTESLEASYERYLHSAQVSSYGAGQSTRSIGGVVSSHPVDDSHVLNIGEVDPATTAKDKTLGLSGGRAERLLPPEATNTLFVEGLPSNCTRREVAHIFRPFVGYKEVRLVSKESRQPGGDPLVLCFVDFVSPAHAATAMDALQVPKGGDNPTVETYWRWFALVPLLLVALLNPLVMSEGLAFTYMLDIGFEQFSGYKFDELDRNSVNLRFQFARYPGARSGGGHRGKR